MAGVSGTSIAHADDLGPPRSHFVSPGGGMIEEHSHIGARTSWVTFPDKARAFLAIPARFRPPFPAVVLGHERYGLVQHTLDLAAKFASYGYVCIAPDMASHWDGDKDALNRGEI